MSALLSILAPLIPYILGILGFVALYFGIKRKGVTEERQRQEAAQQKAQAEVQAKVVEAKGKDAAIDAKVEAQVEAIKKQNPPAVDVPPVDGDVFKF